MDQSTGSISEGLEVTESFNGIGDLEKHRDKDGGKQDIEENWKLLKDNKEESKKDADDSNKGKDNDDKDINEKENSKQKETAAFQIVKSIPSWALYELLGECGQWRSTTFSAIFGESLKLLKPIGAGSISTCFTILGAPTVVKVTYLDPLRPGNIMSALVDLKISSALNELRDGQKNIAPSFCRLLGSWLVRDKLPGYMSRNSKEGYYLVMEQENGGTILRSFSVDKPRQLLSIVGQLCCAFAAAEEELKFEHRDLHHANILVSTTSDKYIDYKVKGRKLRVPSAGLRLSVIDMSLSRATLADGKLWWVRMSVEADDYRRRLNHGDWSRFCPATNSVMIIRNAKRLADSMLIDASLSADGVDLCSDHRWINALQDFSSDKSEYYLRFVAPLFVKFPQRGRCTIL